MDVNLRSMTPKSVIRSPNNYFKPCLSWSKVTSSSFSMRYFGHGFVPLDSSSSLISEENLLAKLALTNSKPFSKILTETSATLNFEIAQIGRMPVIMVKGASRIANILIEGHKKDWTSQEVDWEFKNNPLQGSDFNKPTIMESYTNLRNQWREMTIEMQSLEEENNRIFIEAYGLEDELTPDVPLSEITLDCNPHYRYGGNKNEEELEVLLLADTMKELISYAIGCMMGRYSLNNLGLIYAHSGNIGFDSSKYQTFPADDDGIIPIMDQDWFPDDAANRFVDFLKVAWSPETLDENLKFVADSLKPNRNETPIETIRRYLSTSFFKDHLKTYKKRPIYWLFSSGKQKAFECLVYLHRYNESTLSRMRSTYTTPLQGNFSSRLEFLQNEKDAASTASAKNKFQKEIDQLKKKQVELSKYDDELRHYADMKISLDLDDGVKVNYGKFGKLLAEKNAITGEK